MLKYLYIVLAISLSSCTMNYSFTGAAISPDTKTVSVAYFRNIAPLVNPRLSSMFTEALRDKLLSETRLKLTGSEGDLMFEGDITGYEQSWQGALSTEKAAQNKLTITIKVKYTNNKDPQKSFEKSFSSFRLFDTSTSLSSVEDELSKEMIKDILNQIFSATVADW